MTQPATAREEKHILDTYIDDLMYRYVGGCSLEGLYPGVVFTPSGKARFASIVGWLTGLAQSDTATLQESLARPGSRALAEKLAENLHERLTYLSDYGGYDTYSPEEDPDVEVKVKRFKVVLSDDGTFGGFGICWYGAVPFDQIRTQARAYDPGSYEGHEPDGTHIPCEDSSRRWDAALRKAEEHYRIVNKGQLGDGIDLEAWHGYFPSWDKKRERYQRYWVKYGFRFNGGLLLHGMGHQTFAVSVSKNDGPYWGIHT